MFSPTTQAADPAIKVDLVLEGGGVKGIALLGALAVLEEHGLQPQNLAGTSAGAIVATLYAAGYTHQELYDLLTKQQFSDFLDYTWQARIPLLGNPISVLVNRGVCKGDAFHTWMRRLLLAKHIQTFHDLVQPIDANNLRYRYKVQMIVADLMGHRMLVLPRDAEVLGVDPDALDVALAVRMSMSLALFFKPVRWHNPQTNRDGFLVDGGILSDFPIWLFDTKGEPPWPTFGLRLVADDPPQTQDGWLPAEQLSHLSIVDYGKSLLTTMMEAHDRYTVQNDSFVRTIMIPTLGIQTTDFTLSKDQSQALYNSGRAAAEKFLQTWNFNAYKARYRRP